MEGGRALKILLQYGAIADAYGGWGTLKWL